MAASYIQLAPPCHLNAFIQIYPFKLLLFWLIPTQMHISDTLVLHKDYYAFIPSFNNHA